MHDAGLTDHVFVITGSGQGIGAATARTAAGSGATCTPPVRIRMRHDSLKVVALLVSASIATITGVIFLARIGSASLDAGPPFLLPAFASVFLGATQLKSLHVNVVGTLIAVYVLATGVKGLQLAGSPFWVDDLFNGVALIIAVALSGRAERKQRGGGPKGQRAALGL